MKTIKWFFTYWVMIFVPAFYSCWKVQHKYRPIAVLTIIIAFIHQKKK